MKIYMKKICYLVVIATLICVCSCNNEWNDEQYEQYVSFKAPLNNKGVTQINVRYKSDGKVTYELPLIVSGSTTNMANLAVHISVDSDTLNTLNYERFQNRKDLYYKELKSQNFEIPETVTIPAGENVSVMNVDFTLKDLDLVDKWILPLTIVDNASYNYISNPRKNYQKAILRVIPFNDYSGIYSGTGLKIFLKGYENDAAIVRSEIPAYVVNDSTVFFYAGTVDEDRIDRRNYKILAKFDDRTKQVMFSSDNPEIEFQVNKVPVYSIEEVMDDVRPYLLHRYITLNNIDYNYTDYTSVPGATISYTIRGSLIMERKINTQIPDEDQAIEW